MKQKAVVIETQGKYAVVEVSRAAMCDGCQKKGCVSHTCAAGALLGNSKKMSVQVRNPIGAAVGETVWVESADNKVLGYAALVFLMPVLVCCLLYVLTDAISDTQWIPYAGAAIGFVLSFGVLGWIEKHKKAEEPEIVITAAAPETGDIPEQEI